jgi:glycosyltransferase involved in cell wall biosynthesis
MDRHVGDTAGALRQDRRRVAYYTDACAWPGGAETWLSHVMYGLSEAGWQVSLFLSDRRVADPWVPELESRGVTVTRFRPTREIGASGFREARRLLAGFPIVHFSKTHPRALLPSIPAARSAGAAAVVSTEHVVLAPASRYPFGKVVVARLVRSANGAVDAITTTSEYARRTYAEYYGVPRSRVVNLGVAVPVGSFAESEARDRVRRELGFGPDHFVAVIVGRLYEAKGLERAIEAVPDVLARVPGFRLLLVGSGPLEGALRRLAASVAPEGTVVFAGSRSDVPAVLSASDLSLLASDSETAGLAVIEAMAAGLPVVATDVGGVGEALDDGVTGLLIRPRDRRAIAEAVVSVARLPDRGLDMGRAGRRVARDRFSCERLVGAVTALYERLLASSGAGT